MKTICFYFQVHQPFRLRKYRFFDIGNDHYYYDDYANETILRKIADNCYLPTNKLLLELIKKHKSKFKVSFSISGLALDQFELYAPEVIDSYKELARTGAVEFLSETYAHSLSSLMNKEEFFAQVKAHDDKIEKLFGQRPTVFSNTELIYSDDIGELVAEMGFNAMITEGAKHVLGWKSPNFLYSNAKNTSLKVLLKNFQLSDDIAFRFSNKLWSEYPLTSDKYVQWLNNLDTTPETINLFMDYETFGEHQSADTGIFDFLKSLPESVFKLSKFVFATPSEVAKAFKPIATINVPHPISWADTERDLTAWLGNDLQEEAFNKLYSVAGKVSKISDPKLLKDWLYLQASDHFYYMCTKWFSDGEVHSYFNPYQSPYEAFINYMNVLSDFITRVDELLPQELHAAEINSLQHVLSEKDKLLKQYEDELKRLKNSTKKKKTSTQASKKDIEKPSAKKSTGKKSATKKSPEKK